MSSNEILERIGSLTSNSVLDLLDAMKIAGIGPISSASASPSRFGQTVEIADESGQKYYVALDEYGFVAAIRDGSAERKILYVPMDD